jgi:hypothetical protein
MRERSIKTNRRHKFVECLSSQDVNIGVSFFFKKKTLPDVEFWQGNCVSLHGLVYQLTFVPWRGNSSSSVALRLTWHL